MPEPFHFSEFVVLGGQRADIPLSTEIVHKITEYHLIPLRYIRMSIDLPIYVGSCYRPKWWELYKGRSGTSQHTFTGKGACDVSCMEPLTLFTYLCDIYKRIVWYPDKQFFHCDYASDSQNFFINDNDWKLSEKQIIENLIAGETGNSRGV